MDKTCYKVAMTLETICLTLLVSLLPVTSLCGKITFAAAIWTIYFTFPGTYSTQPAVTTQTFGHKYGGFIYAFLFSSDIINNALVATLAKTIRTNYGWLGLFLIISGAGVVALLATLFFPYRPR